MERFVSFLIGLFYTVSVLAGVVLLAVAQLRSSSGSAFDTWRLNYDANRVLTESHRQQLERESERASDNQNWLNFVDECLKLFDETGLPKSTISPAIIEEAKAAKDGKKKYDELENDDVKCVFRGTAMLGYDKDWYEDKKEGFSERITELQDMIKTDNEEYAELVKDRREFLAFKEMEKTWYSRLFVEIPYDLLVLLLVMTMGALGGMVRILRDYGDTTRPNPSPRDYFFIPLIGTVVAIGGYVLAKTGLLLLSSNKEEASLSRS
jgi:hypothetical protein